jgi:hypothetical protein
LFGYLLKGADMTRTTTKVLAGVAVAGLAAAGVAAVVNHRRGQKLGPDEHAHLAELHARLEVSAAPDGDAPPVRIARILDNLLRNQGISVQRLRRWITGVRQGTLSPEQASLAESDFGALEREADQGGI